MKKFKVSPKQAVNSATTISAGEKYNKGVTQIHIDIFHDSDESYLSAEDLRDMLIAKGYDVLGVDSEDVTQQYIDGGYLDVSSSTEIEASEGSSKIIGRTWSQFIATLEANTPYEVDSVDRERYSQWITLLDDDGNVYDAEVTKYSDGAYELMMDNITGPV